MEKKKIPLLKSACACVGQRWTTSYECSIREKTAVTLILEPLGTFSAKMRTLNG